MLNVLYKKDDIIYNPFLWKVQEFLTTISKIFFLSLEHKNANPKDEPLSSCAMHENVPMMEWHAATQVKGLQLGSCAYTLAPECC